MYIIKIIKPEHFENIKYNKTHLDLLNGDLNDWVGQISFIPLDSWKIIVHERRDSVFFILYLS